MQKKALLICPKFFGYDSEIAKEIQERGYEMTRLNADPRNTLMTFVGVLKRFHLPFEWVLELFQRELYNKKIGRAHV